MVARLIVEVVVVAVVVLVVAAVSPIAGQNSCQGNADGCLVGSGFTEVPSDDTLLCTSVVLQLQDTLSCLNKCGYQENDQINQLKQAVNDRCSAVSGCSNFPQQFQDFVACYDDVETLASNIKLIVTTFNSRLTSPNECLELRGARSCMKRSSQQCPYLNTISNNLFASVDKFDVALYICGSENVPYVSINEECTDNVHNFIDEGCKVGCQLTNAQTVGEFCSILQYQINCIVGHSKKCTQAQEMYLVPRMDTYSLVNQFFTCNITIKGVLIKPLDYSGCDFRKVLSSCFNIDNIDKILLVDVQRIVNLDLILNNFCGLYSMKADQITKCTKSFWSCLLPVSQVYKKTAYDADFKPDLGTFPLNIWGLNYIFNACTAPPYKPALVCDNPGYNVVKTTPGRYFKTTPPIKRRTTQWW